MRNAVVYQKIKDLSMCKSERKPSSDTITLLQLINTKDKFSVTDNFIQTVILSNKIL